MSKPREYTGNFCGCCGRMCGSDDWCRPCAAHISPERLPPWDRTYFATTGKRCPYEPQHDAPDTAWDARYAT